MKKLGRRHRFDSNARGFESKPEKPARGPARIEARFSSWVVVIFLALFFSSVHRAEDWPGWRGPTGMGQTAEKELPLTWGGTTHENVLWQVPIVEGKSTFRFDHNQSSPIVKGKRVFVTFSCWADATKTKEPPEHHVVCFDSDKGKRLWDTAIKSGPWVLSDLRGGYTAPTPVADDERVYALFGSSVIAALDTEGKEVWRREITPFSFDVAIGTSPILYKDTILLAWDQTNRTSRIMALDCKSGELRWEQKRPAAEWAHSTPVLARVQDRIQLLVASAQAVQGVDPENGTTLWTCQAESSSPPRIGDTVTPVLAAGIVYCDSGRGGPGIAVDPTGTGDVSRTHLKWKLAQVPEGFSSPVCVGDHLYRLHNPGVLKCWKLATGEQVFSERLEGVTTASSPIATPEGRIYCVSGGKSFVIQAGAKLQILAVNDLGESGQSSAAVSGGRIFIKGNRSLFCIGKK
jgi:outer membrane protein assembly factor BamB